MREYVVNRPDEAAMRRILDNAGPESVVLRLAWQAGLSRDEISTLTWEQVSFLDDRLELPDRHVPLDGELRAVLWRLYEVNHEDSPRVVLSSRGKTPLRPESISRLARQALDAEGQTSVRLMDLRHDWIIRQLATQDWPTVARISGVEIPALQARFGAYAPAERPARPESADGQVDEFKLWRVLQAERGSPAGLALWLVWQLGLQAQEVIALTWDQVDFERNALCLSDRQVPLTNAVRRLLEDAGRRRGPEDDPPCAINGALPQKRGPAPPVPDDPSRADSGRHGRRDAAGPAAGREPGGRGCARIGACKASGSAFPGRRHGTPGRIQNGGTRPFKAACGAKKIGSGGRQVLSARHGGAAGAAFGDHPGVSGAGGLCLPAGYRHAAAHPAEAVHAGAAPHGGRGGFGAVGPEVLSAAGRKTKSGVKGSPGPAALFVSAEA